MGKKTSKNVHFTVAQLKDQPRERNKGEGAANSSKDGGGGREGGKENLPSLQHQGLGDIKGTKEIDLENGRR